MNRYVKISAALAAFALLLVVMGLSTQNVVQAAPGDISFTTGSDAYVCSSCAAPLNQFNITIEGGVGSGAIKATNLDVARVTEVNPKPITAGSPVFVVQQGSAPTLPGELDADEIRGFNGNRIEIEFTPGGGGGFATYKTVIVDNVKPTLITQSPTNPLIVKGSTAITFQANITDGGSGYTSTVGTSGDTGGIEDLTSTSGPLPDQGGATFAGGVRLVVAGNVVGLDKTNFEAIDGGWNVWATINSSAIQNIGANTPWYFETRDRAGNTRRSGGSVKLTPSDADNTTITDDRFIGNLQDNSFDGSQIEVTRGSDSVKLSVTDFDNMTGAITVEVPGGGGIAEPFASAPITAVGTTDKFALLATGLVTVDSKAPRLASGVTGSATTGVAYNSSSKKVLRGTTGRANSIEIAFADDGKATIGDANGPDHAGSGLEAASVTPGAFTVSNNSVNSVLVVGNNVYLTLSDNLGPDEQPSIVIASGQIMDKAGNAYGGIRISKAADGLGPNLSLSKSSDLSDEDVTVTITTDEQLSKLPDVTLGRVINSGGDVVNRGDQECRYAEILPLLEVVGPLNTGGTCDALAAPDSRTTTATDVAGQPPAVPNPSQVEALSYTYKAGATTVLPDGEIGGKYNVYVEGVDTQNALNKSKIGNSSGANNVGAFTFQIDTALNDNDDPIVKVGESVAVGGDGDAPKVEAIDNLIVTVDFAGETGEYPGDSYRTVDLTLAELTISFKDGTSEKTTFNLTTDINSPDNIQFTLALLNPKVGNYSLKVKATDSAGNASTSAGHTSRWEVVSAKPVPIELQPRLEHDLAALPAWKPGDQLGNPEHAPGRHRDDV